MRHLLLAPLMRWLGRLSYPRLFLLMAGLFALNVVIIDPIPFVDEILLGIATLMIARRKQPPEPPRGRVIDGEARRG